jgi:hypothetical protein
MDDEHFAVSHVRCDKDARKKPGIAPASAISKNARGLWVTRFRSHRHSLAELFVRGAVQMAMQPKALLPVLPNSSFTEPQIVPVVDGGVVPLLPRIGT